jgi:hypothetical protein
VEVVSHLGLAQLHLEQVLAAVLEVQEMHLQGLVVLAPLVQQVNLVDTDDSRAGGSRSTIPHLVKPAKGRTYLEHQ